MDCPISIFQNCGSQKIVIKDKRKLSLPKEQVLKIGIMLIEKGKDISSINEQLFLLTETHLHYISKDFAFKNKKVDFISKAYIELGWMFSLFYVKDLSVSEFKMQLVKRKKRVKFKFLNQSEYEEWKELICLLTLNNNLFDKFNVKSIIGQSDYSMVFKVNEINTGKEFACKRYKKLEMNDVAKNKLISEVTALRKLKGHKNIVELYYIFESNCSVYIILEHCKGGKCIRNRKIYTEERLTFYYNELVHVLAFMKSKGIVHRDINPSNVLLKHKQVDASENEIKLIDFSSVYFVDRQFPKDPYLGTLGYLPPEVLNNATYEPDYSYDVYCVGIMLYNGTTGMRLFEHKNKRTSIHLSRKAIINFNINEFEQLTESRKLNSTVKNKRLTHSSSRTEIRRY